jgi:hypothetical protein
MTRPVIEIELDDVGVGTVKINGHDIGYATKGATIQTEGGKPSTVTLVLWAHDLKIKLPASVITEVREAITPDDFIVDRVTERVLMALDRSAKIGR